MKEFKYIIVLFFALIFSVSVSAQNPTFLPVFPGSSQNSVSFSTINSINLEFDTPSNAGESLPVLTDDTKWLNYNISVVPPDPPLSISVQILSGTIFEGLKLTVEASSYLGPGGGSPGTPAGAVTLSSIPQVLIDNIGTCNTGTGANVGHQLKYTLSIDNYSQVKSSFSTINILYTISQ